MPWSDLLRPLWRAPQPEDATATRPTPPVAISRPRGRPSWAPGGFEQFRSPFNRVPVQANYGLYHNLRQTVPLINAAISKTAEFVGCPEIDAEPDTKADIEAWLAALHVNRLQTGWKNWLSTWLSNALEYGRAHTEIILTADRTDLYALLELHPATIQLRPATDRYSVDVMQNQFGSFSPVKLNPLLLLNAVHNVQGDDPNGTSLLWGLPFVAEIVVNMTRSLGRTWERFGSPRYHVNWDPGDDFSDPSGEQSAAIMSGMAGNFQQVAEDDAEGNSKRDFFTSGKVSVSVIGAAGEQLDFETPMRTLTEQIVAATGIPPFVFGLQWATTERMSAVQAALLSEMIHNLRAEITGEIEYLVRLRQQLSGGDTEFAICWPAPTLLDDLDTSRAALFTEQSRDQLIKNELELWRIGASDRLNFARKTRPDLAKLDDAALLKRLPDLPEEAPEVMPMAPSGSPFGGNNGNNGNDPAAMLRAACGEIHLLPLNGKGH